MPASLQERVIEIGKRIVAERHAHATNLIEFCDEEYVSNEVDDELGIRFQIRIYPASFTPLRSYPGLLLMKGRNDEVDVSIRWTGCED